MKSRLTQVRRGPRFALMVAPMAALAAIAAAPVIAAGQETEPIALRAADQPLLVVGRMDGPEEYQLDDVAGAVRTRDGGIIVGVGGSHEVRRFGADGSHMWTSGRRGYGPGEFRSVKLLPGCTDGEAVFVYDFQARRVTVLDGNGPVNRTFGVTLPNHQSVRDVRCAPNGRFVMLDWRSAADHESLSVAGFHRMTNTLLFFDEGTGGAKLLRGHIPDEDRVTYVMEGEEPISGPRRWGRRVVFAAAEGGVWMGTGDDYRIEFVDWDGKVRREIRWEGPDLSVSEADRDAYRSAGRDMFAEGGKPGWRTDFEDWWRDRKRELPTVVPSISDIRIPRSGGVWVELFWRWSESHRTWLFFENGRLRGRLRLPSARRVLDIGADWVLVLVANSLGVQRLAVYELVKDSESGPFG